MNQCPRKFRFSLLFPKNLTHVYLNYNKRYEMDVAATQSINSIIIRIGFKFKSFLTPIKIN